MSELSDALASAVKDLTENGFDADRVEYWITVLRAAAHQSADSFESVRARLTTELTNTYKRMFSVSALKRTHSQVEPFTIRQLAPQMRAALRDRILASANLIKLDREQSIQRTLARFGGWASSIPRGGTRAVAVRKTAKDLRKHFTSLPYEERRVIIDQGHKLAANISAVIAEHSGAIIATWHSHWRELHYDYRPEHKRRDGVSYIIRDNWALRDGLMKRAGHLYTDEIDGPAEKPYCRCWYAYTNALDRLPRDMLTRAGREFLLRREAA